MIPMGVQGFAQGVSKNMFALVVGRKLHPKIKDATDVQGFILIKLGYTKGRVGVDMNLKELDIEVLGN